MELSSIFQWNALIIASVPGYLSVEAFRPLYDILVEQGEVTDCSDQRWAMGGRLRWRNVWGCKPLW